MSPPLTIALMQSRPLLNPHPKTVVAALLISNPIYHKCRISDHLHLVFQWGIHTAVFLKKQIASFENVYTSAATIRQLRKHEGHPARAPDGTIIEIHGEACPGDSGESVGPWDLENVHLCEGFGDWSAALSRNLQMAVAAGYNINTVNEPKPSREDLDRANMVDGQWLNGKPLHAYAKKTLTALRDGIRDKLGAFLLFLAEKVQSEERKDAVLATLRDAVENALAGRVIGEYNGILGGMINKIAARVEEFIRYLEEKAESRDARNQRVDEVREIIETALRGKEKRKRDDDEEAGGQERKKVMTEDVRKATEQNLTQELTLGAPLSEAEQDARLSRARYREARKQKEKEAEFGDNKAKRDSRDNLSTEARPVYQKFDEAYSGPEQHYNRDRNTRLSRRRNSTETRKAAYEKPDYSQSRAEQHNTGDRNTRSSSRRNSAEICTSAAKAKEAEAYADKGTSPRTPAPYRARARARPRPPPPTSELRKPESPPPPYTESDKFNTYSASVSPAIRSPQAGSIFSPPQMTGSAIPSRITTPGHGPPQQQYVMTAAQRTLEQIHNPGKRYRDCVSGASSPQAQSSGVRDIPSRLVGTSKATFPTTSESYTQTQREISPPYEEEESALVLPDQRSESTSALPALKTSASLSPLSQSIPQSTSAITPQTSHLTTKIPTMEPVAELEADPEVQAPQEEEDEEESLFLPLAQSTPEPIPAAALPAEPPSTSIPVSEPEKAPTSKPIVEQESVPVPQSTPPPASTSTSQSTSTSPLPPHSPLLRESSTESDSDSDLPPPPPKHLFGTSKAPIIIDLDNSDPSPPSPSISRLPTPLIKTEPSSAPNNYILIKDEDSDSPLDNKAAAKREIRRAEVKGRMKAKVKKEMVDVEDDEIVEMWDGEVWAREVRERNRATLKKAREGGEW